MARRKFPFWASTTIADIGNGDPNKEDPGAAKQASGWNVEKPLLQSMNWLQNLFGHFITSNNQVLYTAATTGEIEAGQRVRVNNLTAVGTVTLPALPEEGQWVEIGGQGKYSAFSVTVSGGTNAIMIPADTSCVLDEDNVVYRFYWNTTLNLWKIERVLTGGA